MINALKPDRDKHRFVPVVTYTIMGLVVFLAVGMLLFQSQYIYPRFINLIIQTTENEAGRTGRHLMRVVMKDYKGGRIGMSEDMHAYLDRTSQDYDLWKVKIFTASGETIYSTVHQDVGDQNTHSYFHEHVAKGFVYTKVVQKNAKSAEGQVVTNDVVETYIPIMDKGRFIGALELYYNISVRKAAMDAIISRTNFLLYGLTSIIALAALVATIGIRRSVRIRKQYEDALYASATKDALTGVYNRRRFNDILKWEIDRHIRYQKRASLLMIDIDHFKAVNDMYGHQAGDDVLVAVAKACEVILRKSDFLARYGGEEFLVLLPGTGKARALKVAEKLRLTVNGLSTPSAGEQIQVTVSIGVADFNEVEALSFEQVIKLADDCLYHAKYCGRNKVCTSDELINAGNVTGNVHLRRTA